MVDLSALMLNKKLECKDDYHIKIINEPDNYFKLFGKMPDNVKLLRILKEPIDFIHLFTKSKKELLVELPIFKNYIKNDGCLWISWPKQTSRIISDLDENIVRKIGLMNNLIDKMVCSIDDNWFALKFINRDKVIVC